MSANKCRHALLEHHFTNTGSRAESHHPLTDQSSCGGKCDICKHREENAGDRKTDLSEAARHILKLVEVSHEDRTVVKLAESVVCSIKQQALDKASWFFKAQVSLRDPEP